MKNKRMVFISQPMFGRTDDDILAERERVQTMLREALRGDIAFIDSFVYDDAPEGAGRFWYLGRHIQLLGKADLVYFCNGWEHANGCRIEKKICELYGIPHLFEHDIKICESYGIPYLFEQDI